MACHLREKFDYTPADYDLSFDYNQIPANIDYEDNAELEKRLQKLMPVSKKIHLDLLNIDNQISNNSMFVNSELKLIIEDNTIEVVFK